MKAGLYIRVSTDEQAKEGFSIEAQRQRLISYVQSQGWEIYDFYIDEGQSAKDMNRPELQRMIQDVTHKNMDVVLVFRLDRLTRSVLDLYQLLEQFEKYKVAFKSATEVYDTTSAIGRLFLTLVAALAQWERENLAERVRFGMEEMVRQGKRPGGNVNYGYKSVSGKIFPVESEATVIREIFDRYEINQGIRSIQRWLEEEKIPAPKKKWSTTTINYILRNPIYIGKIRWNLRKKGTGKTNQEIIVEGNHESIISESQFLRVQKLLDKRRSLAPVAATSDFIFAGITRCGKCGYSMSGTSRKYKGRRFKYYGCVNRQKNFHCDMPYLREEWVEEAILDFIRVDLEKKDLDEIEKQIENDEERKEKVLNKIEDLRREQEKAQLRKRKFQMMYVDDLISKEDYMKRIQEMTIEEKRIQTMIDEMIIPDDEIRYLEEITTLLSEFQSTYQTLDVHERKALVQEIFKGITLKAYKDRPRQRPDIEINIEYN